MGTERSAAEQVELHACRCGNLVAVDVADIRPGATFTVACSDCARRASVRLVERIEEGQR